MNLLHNLIFVHSRRDEVLQTNDFGDVFVDYFISYQLDTFKGSFSE